MDTAFREDVRRSLATGEDFGAAVKHRALQSGFPAAELYLDTAGGVGVRRYGPQGVAWFVVVGADVLAQYRPSQVDPDILKELFEKPAEVILLSPPQGEPTSFLQPDWTGWVQSGGSDRLFTEAVARSS